MDAPYKLREPDVTQSLARHMWPAAGRRGSERAVSFLRVLSDLAGATDILQALDGARPTVTAEHLVRSTGRSRKTTEPASDDADGPRRTAGVSATQAAQPRKRPPAPPLGQPEAMPTGTPAATLAEIGVGSLVLALEGAGNAWFKAIVLKMTDGRATLRWPDYPDEPKFSRRVSQLGLLPPERKSA